MHHDSAHLDAEFFINVGANLAIVAGYVIVPFTVLRHLPLTRSVRISGSLFFGLCALTHVSMAFGFEDTRFMLGVHIAQAIAVIAFVWGFYRLLQRADRHRSRGGGGQQ